MTQLDGLSDGDLLRQVVRRDERALALLYDRHSRVVYGLLLRMLGRSSDAEDVLQEVFVRVWSRADTYESSLGSPAAWLARIARNRAIDRLRAQRVRRDVDAVPSDESRDAGHPEPSTLATPEAALQLAATAGRVRGALQSLPEAQRLLIEAAFFDGYTHAELAERFGVPLGTVKGRIRSGLLALRSQLAHAV